MKVLPLVCIGLAILACKKEETTPPVALSGRYIGTISGNFFAADFPASAQRPFSEADTFELSVQGLEGEILGFDSVATKVNVDKNNPALFQITDTRDGGDLRVNATGELSDVMTIQGSYHFPDRSRISFKFIGQKTP